MSPGYAARLKRVYREGGLGAIARRAARKVTYVLWRRNEVWWYERDLALPIEVREPEPGASVDVEAGEETWEWITTCLREGNLGKVESAERRVAARNGHLFPLIRYNGTCVGFMKIGIGDVFVGDYMRVVSFPPGTAVIYDSYVDPDLRGKGLAPLAITEVLLVLRRRGFRKLLCNIPEWNRASHNFVTKCGMMRKKRIRFRRICGFEFLSDNPAEI